MNGKGPFLLYSMDNCVYCDILKKRLDFQGVLYVELSDKDTIAQMGFDTVPRLDIGGEILDFNQAIVWLNNLQEDK